MAMDQSLRARPVRGSAVAGGSRSSPNDGDVEIGLLSVRGTNLKPDGSGGDDDDGGDHNADDGSYISSDDDLSRTQDFSASHALLSHISSNNNTRMPDASPVYITIHRIRRLVAASIDEPYTLDQLRKPRMISRIVQPLVAKLYNPTDLSIVYCLLVNRVQFLRSQSPSHSQTVNIARASLCELVATRVLRRFHEDNRGTRGLLVLANILVSGFDPFQGAPDNIRRGGRRSQWPVKDRGGHERKFTALELAILSESKLLISSSTFERVVTAVHRGIVTYTPLSFVDVLPDHYEHMPVSLYNPHAAPFLNHSRLIVPRTRNMLELFHFVILVLLYILTMVNRGNDGTRHIFEAVFNVFAAGWVLEQFAAIIEHGWEVHSQNLGSFLDVTFIAILALYAVARMIDLGTGPEITTYPLHILCVAAPVLLTRVAFTILPESIVFIAIHVLMKDFMRLVFIAFWCFTGFLVALMWLEKTNSTEISDEAGNVVLAPPEEKTSWAVISKWLLWIWFSLDGTGIEKSVDFDVILGPILMVAFAFLGNTFFLTILVAILTNTFSKIIEHQAAEVQFRRTVLTFQGVKSDSIFMYPPPFNILALAILLPLKLAVTPLTFHKVNVWLIQVLNAPIIMLINGYERRRLWRRRSSSSSFLNWNFTGFSPHGDIEGVFEVQPPPDIQALLEEMDSLDKLKTEKDEHESSNETERGGS